MNDERALAADDLRIQRIAVKVYFHREWQNFADRVAVDWIEVERNSVARAVDDWMAAHTPSLLVQMRRDNSPKATIIFADESGVILLSIRRLSARVIQLGLPFEVVNE